MLNIQIVFASLVKPKTLKYYTCICILSKSNVIDSDICRVLIYLASYFAQKMSMDS